MDLIFLDVIVRNGDRHEFNYGVLIDGAGGVDLAPNFDNNLALFHNGVPADETRRNDVIVDDFIVVCENVYYKLPELTFEILRNVFEETQREWTVEAIKLENVINFCYNAYARLMLAAVK
jgi:hypothetical protein